MLEHNLGRNGSLLSRGHIPDGRRVLDLAEGILIGLRRYPAEAAFGELVRVAHLHQITVSAAASALVGLATGRLDVVDCPAAAAIAELEWGTLLPATSGANERHN